MTRGIRRFTAFLMAWLLVAVGSAPAIDIQLHAPLPSDGVRARTLAWVETQGADAALKEPAADRWEETGAAPSVEQLLDRVIETFVALSPEAKQLVDECRLTEPPLEAPGFDALVSAVDQPFFQSNLAAYRGRALTQRRMYDEALELFALVRTNELVDPAGYFFHKAVCEQELLQKTEAQESLERLLRNTEAVPLRYSTVANLMQHDLESLEEKSLDEVSRLMADSERRLDLGRGGEKVQEVQERIIASLDEIIEKMEQQQGGGGGSSSGQGGSSNQGSAPADDSRVKGSTAPGEVEEKRFSKEAGWGALPPKEQAKAKNIINRDFPAHYRQAIENYFKKLATRPAAPSAP